MDARPLRPLAAFATLLALAAAAPRDTVVRGAIVSPAPRARPGIGMPPAARPDTDSIVPPRAHPTAGYGSFARARAGLVARLRVALGAYADSAAWYRGDAKFTYRDSLVLERSVRGEPFWVVQDRSAPVSVPCLRVTLVTHTADAAGNDAIEETLATAGWARDPRYGADGPDGTSYAMTSREALCVIRAAWDGGDDSDTTYVPAPGEDIELICVPLAPERPWWTRSRR